jgi:hypothetical protein
VILSPHDSPHHRTSFVQCGETGRVLSESDPIQAWYLIRFSEKWRDGYYAYVTSKFSNRLIFLDYDKNNDGNPADAEVAGWVALADDTAPSDDTINGNKGMGGHGLLPVPNVYNGWVQELPKSFCDQLSPAQRNPVGPPVDTCPAS